MLISASRGKVVDLDALAAAIDVFPIELRLNNDNFFAASRVRSMYSLAPNRWLDRENLRRYWYRGGGKAEALQ